MASTGNLWWFTPLQSFAVIGTAINFGGSALQSPLIMPMLRLQNIPAHHAGTMTDYLLHNSEFFFPPLNGACTLTNLVLTVTAYLNRVESSVAAAKLPYLGASLALNLATTAYALGIMVPMNKAMGKLAKNLQANEKDEKSEKELRRLQARWQKLNYGRALIMIGSSITALYGLLEDGAVKLST